MDTKLKVTNKFILFIIAVVLMTSSMVLIFEIARLEMPLGDAFTEKSYADSDDALSKLYYFGNRLIMLGTEYISDDYIKEGNLLEISYYDFHYETRRKFDYFAENYTGKRSTENAHEDEYILNAFIEAYPDSVLEIENRKILDDLENYNRYKNIIENQIGLEYYFKNDQVTIKNVDMTKDEFMSRKLYYLFDSAGEHRSHEKRFNYWHELSVKNDVMYISFSDDYISTLSKEWSSNRSLLQKYLIVLPILMATFFIVFYNLLKNISTDTKWILSDWFLEIILTMDLILIGLSTSFVAVHDTIPSIEYFIVFSIFISTISLYTVLQTVKHYKQYKLRKTLCYKFISFLGRHLGNLISKTPFIFRMLPNFRNVEDFRETIKYVDKIKAGEFDYAVDVKSGGLYGKLLTQLDTIKIGMEAAVNNELKSERLKSELITNVSHDIRTPLTSIVTYLDLLNKEADREKQLEYIGVLNNKVDRLNILIEDLFDAAKISSGSVPINLEQVDIKQLIQQIVGEHYEYFISNDLTLVEHMDEVSVLADRKSLWRVIDNLISNITKYALNSSRVYIDVKNLGNQTEIIFKNISEHPLNIDAEELKLRFKRGDEARASKGSGLGLAIAEDLVKLQSGKLDITIDGDLFKAVVTLNNMV